MRVLEWPGKRGKAILGEPRVESRETNILSRLRSIPWPFLIKYITDLRFDRWCISFT